MWLVVAVRVLDTPFQTGREHGHDLRRDLRGDEAVDPRRREPFVPIECQGTPHSVILPQTVHQESSRISTGLGGALKARVQIGDSLRYHSDGQGFYACAEDGSVLLSKAFLLR